MSRSVLTIFVPALVLMTPALGQDSRAARPAADQKATGTLFVRFHDGGMLRLSFAESVLDVTTRYGKLKITTADIRKIELATRIPEKAQLEIGQAIRQLGDEQFKVREAAEQKLKSFRELAYADLIEAAAGSDQEVKQRAQKLLNWLRETVSPERLRIRQRDIIYTEDSVFAGRIETNVIQVESVQFGKLELKLTDAASITFVGSGSAVTELKLDGTYALANEVWLDTGLDFYSGSHLTVEAQGEIDMYATGGYNGQYVGTPRGKKAWPGNTGLPYEPGTLIGRFGRGGSPFVIGGNYDGRVGQEGRLYLRAAGNPYSVQTNGEYTIRISGGIPAR